MAPVPVTGKPLTVGPKMEGLPVRRCTAPEEDLDMPRGANTATQLQRAGVRVNIGAHGQHEGLGGLPPQEALRTTTINPAKTFGLNAELGSLEAGKLADRALIDGDVLGDMRHSDRIRHEMQNGLLDEAATLNGVVSRQRPRANLCLNGPEDRAMHVETHAFWVVHGDGTR